MLALIMVEKKALSRKLRLLYVLIYLVCLATITAVNGQSPDNGSHTQIATNPVSAPARRNRKPANPYYKLDAQEYVRSDHKQAVALPNLPEYTGRVKSMQCSSMPRLQSGQMIWITYDVKEEWPVVANWYTDAFRDYRWIVDRGLVGNDCVAAVDSKFNACQVLCNRSGKQGCEFTVQYKCAP